MISDKGVHKVCATKLAMPPLATSHILEQEGIVTDFSIHWCIKEGHY